MVDDFTKWMNANIYLAGYYNVTTSSLTANPYFTYDKLSQDMTVQGTGVAVSRSGEGSALSSNFFEYAIFTPSGGLGGKVQDPTICLTNNDINRLKAFGTTKWDAVNVVWECFVETQTTAAVPCLCPTPSLNIPVPAKVSVKAWQMATAALGVIAVLLALVVTCMWTRRKPSGGSRAASSYGMSKKKDAPRKKDEQEDAPPAAEDNAATDDAANAAEDGTNAGTRLVWGNSLRI